jgi:hypothetical protein
MEKFIITPNLSFLCEKYEFQKLNGCLDIFEKTKNITRILHILAFKEKKQKTFRSVI